MMTDREVAARRIALLSWTLLAASIALWPFIGAGIGYAPTILALVPLLLPVRGLLRGTARTLQWSSFTLAPALVLTLTELLTNAPARVLAALTLALILGTFSATVALLRVTARDR